MNEESKYNGWTDIIDQIKYGQTGTALLYRNPKISSTSYNTSYDPTNHIYSLEPGENCLFNQKPVAYGFTAYIGHDEIVPGYNSLRSNRRSRKLGYQTLDYYKNYTSKLFEKYDIEDKQKPRPKSEKRLQVDFYTELIAAEEQNLEESKRFYSESQNEEDHLEKANLKEYVIAYIEWLEDKFSELNPEVNNFKGLGGLNEAAARYVYKELKGNFIHSKTKQEHFVAIFQNRFLPDGWKKVEWEHDKASLISLMDQVFSMKVEPRFINRYFNVKGSKIHGHHRTITEHPEIKKILNYAKTIRPSK